MGSPTFAVMAYIIFLNPYVLTLNGMGRAPQVASFAGIATATCLAAALMTIAMGWYTNYPFALAPSLGISTVLAADLIATGALSWQAAMGLLVVGGLLVTALVVLGLGDALVRAIPLALKRAIGVGIGLLLLNIGLLNAGIVRVQPEQLSATRLPVSLGSLTDLPTALALLGLLLTLGLMLRGHKAALLYGILASTVVAIITKWFAPGLTVSHASGVADLRHFVALPLDTSTIGSGLNLTAFHSPTSVVRGLGMGAALLVMVTLMLSSLLDTVGTIVGVGEQAGLVDRQGRAAGGEAGAGDRLAGDGGRRAVRGFCADNLCRVGGRGSGWGADGPGGDRDRAVLCAGTGGHAVCRADPAGGDRAGADHRRVPDVSDGARDRLRNARRWFFGAADAGADPADLLDHQRHRGGRDRVCSVECGGRAGTRGAGTLVAAGGGVCAVLSAAAWPKDDVIAAHCWRTRH